MRTTGKMGLGLAIAMALLLWAAAASAQESPPPTTARAIDGGVQLRADEEVIFEYRHPSLFDDPGGYRESGSAKRPVAPVGMDGSFYYALGQDLLRLDPAVPAIVDRWRMPATVVGLEAGDEVLTIALQAYGPQALAAGPGGEQDSPAWVTMDYRPGDAPPGRGLWDWAKSMGAVQDVMWLDAVPLEREPGAADRVDPRKGGEERALIEALREREEVDQANPYLPFFRGEAWLRLGDKGRAEQAFEEAIDDDDADWIDLARMAMRLEYRDQPALAETAIAGAEAKMEAAGVRGDYMLTMANATFAMVWHGEAMRQALAADDVEKAHRVAGHVNQLFPNLEGSAASWLRLSRWFAEQGAEEKARHWQERAQQLQGTPRFDDFYTDAAGQVDWYLTAQLALLITLLLAGAVLGLRRRPEGERKEEDSPSSWQRLMPRFYRGDLGALVALFALAVALPMTLGTPIDAMITAAQAPAALTGDALAAPTAAVWIDEMAPSPAAQTLGAAAGAEFEAIKAGELSDNDADVQSLLMAAIAAHAQRPDVPPLSEMAAAPGTVQDFGWLGPLLDFGQGWRGALLLFVGLVLNALILGGLLQALIGRVPVVARWGRRLIPGAPLALGPMRLVVLALFFFGMGLVSPLSRSAQAITEQELVGYFGLESAPSAVSQQSLVVGFGILAIVLVAQAVGIWRAAKSGADAPESSGQ